MRQKRWGFSGIMGEDGLPFLEQNMGKTAKDEER